MTGKDLCSLSTISNVLNVQVTLCSFSSRFQLRVALYIAACLGHLDLAHWLIERGVHAEEPVGVHPYRQWCHQTAHRDSGKCPIHVAAEMSQLLILKLFVAKNVLTLACRDSEGRDPLKIAIHCGYRNCVRYLANKLCSVVSLANISLPMRIYLQMKRWVSLGQKRVSNNQCQWNSVSFKAKVEDMLLVDGFSLSKMSSKSIKAEAKSRGEVRAKALQPLPPTANFPQLSVQSVTPEIQKRHKQGVKQKKNVRLDKMKKGDNRSRFTLPPITTESLPRPMLAGALPKSYNTLNASLQSSHHGGRAPRQNAMYCLSIARSLYFLPYTYLCNKNLIVLKNAILFKSHRIFGFEVKSVIRLFAPQYFTVGEQALLYV